MVVKSFRLFVSSTFKDFAQERELLQSRVFPALDACCAAHGYQFHAVDLRWGVNEEAQLDQRTAEICLSEVSAAKGYPAPNFLAMIGDRYGWVPLPFAIGQDEFEAATAWLESRGEREVVRNLRHVYQLDENHAMFRGLLGVPGGPGGSGARGDPDSAAYTLRSREDEIAELKDAVTWEKLEGRLRSALQAAADHLLRQGRIDAAGHQKYFLSLTEQEILRGVPSYSRRRAREGIGAPAYAGGPQAIAWIRETGAHPVPTHTGLLRRWLGMSRRTKSSFAPEPNIAALTAGIRHALPDDCVINMKAEVNATGKLDETYLTGFVSTIQRRLEAVIDQHVASVRAQEQGDEFELQKERAEHSAFAEERRKVFIGRESNRAAIAGYIGGSGSLPLVLHGSSGSGKSALMARAVADAEAAGGSPVVYRFIGASATSSELRTMLVSLVNDLAARGIAQKPEQWEDNGEKFVRQVRELLSASEKPVSIFVDGLDQLRRPYRPGWLPEQLPSEMKLVVSVLDDEAHLADSGIYRSLRQRLPVNAFLEIEPLGLTHAYEILTALEQDTRRRLQPSQRDYVVGQFMKAGGSPLYLRVAFEIARGWRSSERAGPGGRLLTGDTTSAMEQLIEELWGVHHHEPELVRRALGYIAAAKDGLSESELTAVLSRDGSVMQAISSEQYGAHTSKLPVSVWVRLRRHLDAFLVEKRVDEQPLLEFFHRQFAEVVRQHYYVGTKVDLHDALASYFQTPVDARPGAVASSASGGIYSKRSLSELPFQLFHAERRSGLDEILMAPSWIEQKVGAFDAHALIADFEQFGRGPAQGFISRTLRLTAGIIARDKRQVLPQLVGRVIGSTEESAQAFLNQAQSAIAAPALVPFHSSLTPPAAEIMRLEGHTAIVTALAVLGDGILASGSEDNTVRLWELGTGAEICCLEGHTDSVRALAALMDGRLASASEDKTVRLWDPATGAETARLVGHRGPVYALAALPDRRIASGSRDGTIRFWDTASGTEADQLTGHRGPVTALVMLPDGRLASASGDRTVRIWDLSTGEETARLVGHSDWVAALAVLADGRLASGSHDQTVRLWNVSTGVSVARLSGHTELVRALAALPSGVLASGSWDETVRIWNPATGREAARFEGHEGLVEALAVLPNGNLASGSYDATVRIWEGAATPEVPHLEAHSDAVLSLAALPDGRVVSGSRDGTGRLWETASGAEIARLQGHAGRIAAFALLPDGRLASGSQDATVRLWDLRTCALKARLDGRDGRIGALAVLPDGRVAFGTFKGVVHLWNPSAGSETEQLEGGDRVWALAVLADGRLSSASRGGVVRLWDTRSCEMTHQFEARAQVLAALPDGRLAAGVGEVVRLWDTASGSEGARLEGHTGGVHALAVLPDGLMASGSSDNTIRLWDLAKAKEIFRLEVDAAVNCLVGLSNGDVVAGDELGRLHWLEVRV